MRRRIVRIAMDFLYASAEAHTLPPRKRLACVLRDVAHSPTDLGSKKARLAGEAYVRTALRDPRLLGKALEIVSEERYDVDGGSSDRENGGASASTKSKKGPRNMSSSSLNTATATTEKKKKKLSTKRDRSTTQALKSDEDDDDDSNAEPKELTDEQMAMKLHLEMNASPRMSRGSSRSTQMLTGRALFG